jgi:hypothetical protein
MGDNPAIPPAGALVLLVLRTHRAEALIHSDEDWHVLESIAARMLFWSGGAIYAARCEGGEMRFALQVLHASLGTIAHQLAGAYATHLRKTRHIKGRIFDHYLVTLLCAEVFLNDLVFWLHRPRDPWTGRAAAGRRLWTAESAYLLPGSMPWIDTTRLLRTLGGVGAAGPATYRCHKMEPISARAIDRFAQRAQRLAGNEVQASQLNIETISRRVADYCRISYEDMVGDTRKRAVSRARAIATVLATRSGTTAAAAARHFKRSRSALIEQVEHYRASQPEIFSEAQSRLDVWLADTRE